MKLYQVFSFYRRFLPLHFCSRNPRFSSRKFGPFLTMQFFIAMKLVTNRAHRQCLIRYIESFQIRKILADSFASQDVPQEYNDHLKFLCDWLISTACRRQNIDLVKQAIEMGSYPAARAVYSLMVMQRRLPQEKQIEALHLLSEGNQLGSADCTGGLALFCAFNGAIDRNLRIKLGGGTIICQFFSACRSAKEGSPFGKKAVAKLLRFFANTKDDRGRPLEISPENEFLRSRFPELMKETVDFFYRYTDREPYIHQPNMLKMAEELEQELQQQLLGNPLLALLRF